MRLIYYALGGGLGHLVRARAFLQTLGCVERAAIFSASEFARDRRITGDLEVLSVPTELERDRAALRRWLSAELVRFRADCLCVDAFPAGLLGELGDFPPVKGLALWHVARLLRWAEYQRVLSGGAPRFERCFRLEELSPEHHAFLVQHCARVEHLELSPPRTPYSGAASSSAPAYARQGAWGPEAGPYWLIVHSGPAAEVVELIAFANEVRAVERAGVALWVISPHAPRELPEATYAFAAFPARDYFRGAQRIFTAAGFNVMQETRSYRDKHVFVPMPRRFDDQFERARRARHAR